MKLIIYLPAYNEEETLKQVIANLPMRLNRIDLINILVVDDGSIDRTAELARSMGAQVISHSRNCGVGAAFQSAVKFALENEADLLVSIDADGQFDPLDIPNLITPILHGKADVVIGNRFYYGKPQFMSSAKYWGNRQVAKLISNICRQNFQDVSCGFRAYGREALFNLNLYAQFTYTHESILSLVYNGLRVIEQPVSVKYFIDRKSRVAGSLSHYSFQISKIILRVLLDYRPIRVFGSLGGMFMVVGVGFEIYLLSHYFLYGSFSPYKSTGFIGLGFIIFGLLVLVIALVADMLNRLRIKQDRILYELKRMRYDN